MSNIPFEKQFLPTNLFEKIKYKLAQREAVLGDELIEAIEQCIHQALPQNARSVLRLAVIPAVKTRGRPSNYDARLDLALDKVDQRYPALLRYEKRKKDLLRRSGKAAHKDDSPSLIAYARLQKHMKGEFGPMTAEALKNKHSAWRKGRFHSAENHVDSEDYDAEIDQRFPFVPES
jgi:hypothetical protein